MDPWAALQLAGSAALGASHCRSPRRPLPSPPPPWGQASSRWHRNWLPASAEGSLCARPLLVTAALRDGYYRYLHASHEDTEVICWGPTATIKDRGRIWCRNHCS